MAERIARTEGARARYDAFIARNGEDEDVVAYKWKLGSRHPAEDICDMYANADLYGLGKGVFPKDKATAQPAHPHCLCHYAPVYEPEIKGKERSYRGEKNGNAWLKNQPLSLRQAILGVKGEKEWQRGRVSWMEKADVQQDFRKKESRLLGLFLQLHGNKNNTTNNRLKNDIINKEIPLTEPLNFVNPEGTLSFIPFSTIIKVKRVIAGAGSDVVFRKASEYTSTFGGDMGLWQKVVGKIESARYSFDIHWVRRIDDNLNVRFKIKSFKERRK